jgi:hypothetical protein
MYRRKNSAFAGMAERGIFLRRPRTILLAESEIDFFG